MIKQIFITLMVVYIAQINCDKEEEINKLIEKNKQLLQDIKDRITEKGKVLMELIPRCQKEVKEGQQIYYKKAEAALSQYKNYSDRAESIKNKASKEDETKCVNENIERMKEEKKRTEGYNDCLYGISEPLDYLLLEFRRQVSWIEKGVKDLEGKVKLCGASEKCNTRYNDELEKLVKEYPVSIQKRIDYVKEYCENVAGKDNEVCNPYWSDFQNTMSTLVKQAEACLSP